MSQLDSPPVIDFEALLAPIQGENRAGFDLREMENRKYYEVRDDRKVEIDNERNSQRFAMMSPEDLEKELGLLQADPRRPVNWGSVVKKATSLVANTSKDLWVVAWLIEALVREHGMAGLRDGIRVCRELCEEYWESILPRPNEDEGGVEWTLSQLNGLDDTLGKSIDRIPLFRKELLTPKERVMTLLTYEQAEKLNGLALEERSSKIAGGATCVEDFHNAAKKASLEELSIQAATNAAAAREVSQYFETLQKLSSASLRVSNIESAIAKFSNRFDLLTKVRLATVQPESGASNMATTSNLSSDEDTNVGTLGVSTLNRQIITRDEALDGLLKVADFFRRTEPHSPVSYALEQAVRWGRMPLPELLGDLISNIDVREEMFRRLGIQNPEEKQNSEYDN